MLSQSDRLSQACGGGLRRRHQRPNRRHNRAQWRTAWKDSRRSERLQRADVGFWNHTAYHHVHVVYTFFVQPLHELPG